MENKINKLKGYFSLVSAFFTMLCLGGIYTWSIFAVELSKLSGFNYVYSQLIFGFLIAIFTISMTFGKKLFSYLKPANIVTIAGVLFFIGYFITYLSNGKLLLIFIGMSIFSGIATGLGYLVSISIPVLWFPNNKGLVLGIISGGFGAGSIVLSYLANYLLKNYNVFQVFFIIGILYGSIIFLFSLFIKRPDYINGNEKVSSNVSLNINFIKDINFKKLFLAIFTGTFAGLLVIGNLKSIGLQCNLKNEILVLGVALFSLSNFIGRVLWGWLNDYIEGKILIPLSLILIGLFTLLLGNVMLTEILFVMLSILVGVCFGANFVLYARETAHIFGLNNLSYIYPYVFLGYGISGIFGPILGGIFYKIFGNFKVSSLISFVICIVVVIAYLKNRSHKPRD